MADKTLTILLPTQTPAEYLAQIRTRWPQISIMLTDDVKQQPELMERVEITLGSVPTVAWPYAKHLRWMQAYGAGVDRLLTPEVKAHPAIITNARIHAEPISEHLFGMLLMFVRRLHIAYRQQMEHHWGEIEAPELLPGKVLGIVGVGNIGARVAEIAKAFRMTVLGMRHSGQPAPSIDRMYTPAQKAEMLPQCDYLMLTIPLTPETHHFIGTEELALMRPCAYLFNIGRGKLVDTDALITALREGQIADAGLDVTDPEPLPADHPLWGLPNVIITPHNAGWYSNYVADVMGLFLDNLGRYLAGEPLRNVVDKERGY